MTTRLKNEVEEVKKHLPAVLSSIVLDYLNYEIQIFVSGAVDYILKEEYTIFLTDKYEDAFKRCKKNDICELNIINKYHDTDNLLCEYEHDEELNSYMGYFSLKEFNKYEAHNKFSAEFFKKNNVISKMLKLTLLLSEYGIIIVQFDTLENENNITEDIMMSYKQCKMVCIWKLKSLSYNPHNVKEIEIKIKNGSDKYIKIFEQAVCDVGLTYECDTEFIGMYDLY